MYNQDWTAHLPASRWDGDGGYEMMEVHNLIKSLPSDLADVALPDWVDLLLAGRWQDSLAALGSNPPAPEFKSRTVLLDTARRLAANA